MSLLNTFFLRYRADTGQAVKNIKELSALEDKVEQKHDKQQAKRKKDDAATNAQAKKSKENAKDAAKSNKDVAESFSKTEKAGKAFGKSLTEVASSSDKLTAIRGAASGLGEVMIGLGPAAAVAVVGIGAVVAAVKVASEAIDDAREGAKEAIELGERAYAARLAQGELIRLQSRGRAIGLSDEAVAQSAEGVNSRGEEIRAAQRQAARDPASAFNNPLIKQANLWKKAGVEVGASLEKQIEQQNKYLRSLQESGQGERALIEGVQLFGRSLADVKAVVSTTQKQINNMGLSIAKESERRRDLQEQSEKLATTEQKLANHQKANDERIRSKTIPATIEFSKAVDEWTQATSGLHDAWGSFVSFLIEGMTKIVEAGTGLLHMVGIGPETRTLEEQKADAVKKAGDAAELNARAGNFYLSPEKRAAIRKQAEEEAAMKFDAEEKARQAAVTGKIGDAAAQVAPGGKFEGKDVSAEKLAQAQAKTAEIIKNDPNVKTLEDIKTILSNQLHQETEQGKVQKAQTDYTKKIESNTLALVNTGLEQAMALWAANVGAGSGVSAGGYRGETSGAYEARVRQMQKTINPNAQRTMSMDRAAVGAMSGQADAINKSKPTGANSSGGVGDIKIDKIEVVSHATDVSGVAKDFGTQLKNELRYAVAEFASPVVS
jgi:hypothetical protein